jgi:hypothetical protein
MDTLRRTARGVRLNMCVRVFVLACAFLCRMRDCHTHTCPHSRNTQARELFMGLDLDQETRDFLEDCIHNRSVWKSLLFPVLRSCCFSITDANALLCTLEDLCAVVCALRVA